METTTNDHHRPQKSVYIATLGVLAPYRRRGLGHLLIQHVIDAARQSGDVAVVWVNVQTSNEQAKRFYERHGLKIVETLPDYYKSESVKSAWLMRYDIK
jgi:ribosomal protein S18 acetylase RimI-like enzyme